MVFGVGFALLLPCWFGLNGVLYSMPVHDLLTFRLGLLVIAKIYRIGDENGLHQVKFCEN